MSLFANAKVRLLFVFPTIHNKIYSFFLKKVFFDKKRYKNEKRFRSELTFSDSIICDLTSLEMYETDCFLVGSDQVWNPFINGFDASYALSFKTSAKKIAYSASLGIDKNVPQKWLNTLADSLADFSYISVREESAKNILKPFVIRTINVDLDPTLLLNAKDYEPLEKKSSIKITIWIPVL